MCDVVSLCWTICKFVHLSVEFCSIVPNYLNGFAFPDVYSYDEDDMVLDSKLPEHLSHFGIDMMTMEKASTVSAILKWNL